MKSALIVNPEVEKRLSEKDQIFENAVKAISIKQQQRSRPTFLDSGEENELKDARKGRKQN